MLREDRLKKSLTGSCPMDCLYKDMDDPETWEGQNWGLCFQPGDCNCVGRVASSVSLDNEYYCPNLE